MINATFNRPLTISAPPPKVHYPFLFRAAVGDNVYLRISQSQIIRLYSSYPDGVALQGTIVNGTGPLAWSVEGEQEAWALRLKPGESVTLSNP